MSSLAYVLDHAQVEDAHVAKRQLVARQVADKALVLKSLRDRMVRPQVARPGHLGMEAPALDAWLGGWPLGAISEVAGLPGSGRLALVLPLMRRLARRGARVVVIDPAQSFHPPSLPELCESVLLLRPPPAQAAWAAEQAARAGAVELVVLLDLALSGRAGMRLGKAAEAGGTAVIAFTERADPDVPASLRLLAAGWADPDTLRVECSRARDGRAIGERCVRLVGG